MDQETLGGQLSDYRIYELIASGGFASVYIGRDTASNVPVAVKRLHPHLKTEPGIAERFEQEAATVRGLMNPRIVRLIDQGRDADGVPFIVMEWIEGLTINDRLKRQGRFEPDSAAAVGCQVLEGLDAAWARRIVHRDIKPANLMITPSGQLKIMDFGVAKDVELATMVGSSGLIGTPAYMAPEQLRGRPLDCRADMYALGITLYAMLAGHPPFEGPSFADYFRQHLDQPPPPLAMPYWEVLRTALAKEPEQRYASPAEMLAALQPFAGSSTLTPPVLEAPATEIVRERTEVVRGGAPAAPEPVAPQPVAPEPVAPEPVGPQPVAHEPMAVAVPPARSPQRFPLIGIIAALVVLAVVVLGGFLLLSRQAPPQTTLAAPTTVPPVAAPTVGPTQAATPSAAPAVVVAPSPSPVAAAPTWHLVGVADTALFNEPVGLAIDPQGITFVSNNGSHTIDRLDAAGNLTARWGGGANGQPQLHNPAGVAADDNGALYVADTGNDRVMHLSSTGNVLGQVGGHGQAPGQFDGPRAVAVDGSDNLYVADSGNHRIQKIGSDGKVLAIWGSFGSGPANFNFPFGLAFDSQFNLYVADRNNNRVVKLSPQGTPLATFATDANPNTALTNPSGVAVDATGNVYVAGWVNDRVQRIQKLDSAGKLLTTWTIENQNPAQLSLPYQVGLDPKGNLHVAEPAADRVDEFSPDGKAVGALGATRDALGQFRRPNSVAIDSHDRVYVTDWGNERVQSLAGAQGEPPAQWGRFVDLQGVTADRQGNILMTEHSDCRVRRLSSPGETTGLWGSCGSGQGQFRDPEAIASDTDGNLYVADRGNDRIVKLSPAGDVVRAFGTHGSGDGQFDQPTGVALDLHGNIFVADRNNRRIVELSPTFQIEAIWGPALQLMAPEGVAVDSTGNVFVADWGASRIVELSSSGALIAELGTAGSGLGQFDAPEGLAVDSQDRVYVADTGNNRVQVFSP